MDDQKRPRERSHRATGSHRPVAKPYRSQRKGRSSAATIAIVVVTVILIVAFVSVRAGVWRLFKPGASTAGTSAPPRRDIGGGHVVRLEARDGDASGSVQERVGGCLGR